MLQGCSSLRESWCAEIGSWRILQPLSENLITGRREHKKGEIEEVSWLKRGI